MSDVRFLWLVEAITIYISNGVRCGGFLVLETIITMVSDVGFSL